MRLITFYKDAEKIYFKFQVFLTSKIKYNKDNKNNKDNKYNKYNKEWYY